MQFEILQELAEYRANKGDDYLKPSEVLQIIKSKGLQISHKNTRVCWALAQLESYGYLEAKVDSLFRARRYRIKSIYVEKFSKSVKGLEIKIHKNNKEVLNG